MSSLAGATPSPSSTRWLAPPTTARSSLPSRCGTTTVQRMAATRRSHPARTRSRQRHWSGATPSSSGSPARSMPASRSRRHAWWRAATTRRSADAHLERTRSRHRSQSGCRDRVCSRHGSMAADPVLPRREQQLKIAVIGGGSTYTPELIDGFARLQDELPVREVVLMDPAVDRLELVGGLAGRIFSSQGHPGKVQTTSDVDEAVDGADAVLLQLRVGGQAARHLDETWPLQCGCVGQETTGAGGLAKALRTVPVVLDIADRVREAAPAAWIIDFTNPVGIVTRALLQDGHRAVGLCNVAIGFQRRFAEMLGVAPERLELDHVGLNHLTWERAARVDGVDRLPELLAAHAVEIAE